MPAKETIVLVHFVNDEGEEFKTSNQRHIQFIRDMEMAGIPWRVYSGRGMFGEECPAAVSSDEFSEHDIIRATKVGLTTDSLGLNVILYAR